MSDLTEFLLARIAEDEAEPDCPGSGEYAGCDRWSGRHELEAQAKRRIVEDFEVLHRDYRETHDPGTEARRFQALVAMAHLAAIYADHPDYREEWRP